MSDLPNQEPGTLGMLRGQLVQKADGNITPPTNIIQNVTAARALYMRYRTQNLSRNALFASIEGLIAGNPPYDPVELEQKGLSHIANFNNGDASSLFEQGALAYWNLLHQAETLVKFIFHDESNPDFVGFANIMARKLDTVLREWEDFERQNCTNVSQILKYGYSPVVWPDEADWRWKTAEVSRFFLPDQASTDTSLLTTIFIETSYTVQELYHIYETFKDTPVDESPWNLKNLCSFLINRANNYAKFEPPVLTMQDLQSRITNNDISFDTIFTDEVRLVSLLQKEYDGKISHYIFDRVLGSGSSDLNESGGFLFFIDRQYESLKEVLLIFTASPGVFTIHANRGLGHKIFSPCQATMQIDCDVVNMSRLASSPIIRTPATGARDFDPIQITPGVPMNIGAAEFAQNNLGANIVGLVNAGNYILNKLNVNIAHSGDDPGQPDSAQGSVSDSQARRKSFKEFGVLKNNIAHYYKYEDSLYNNIVVKMIKAKKTDPGFEYADRWMTRCKEAGVPEEIFALDKWGCPKYFRTKASRVAGDGSTLALIMALETLFPVVPSLSAKGVKRYTKDLVMATMGADYVAAYVGTDEPDETSGGASLAGVENALMKLGESPIFSQDNEQRAHIKVHLELGKYIVDGRTQEQMSARDADKIFTVLIPHLGEHIQFIAQNPMQRSFFEGVVKKDWGQLSQYASLNRKNAENELQSELKKRAKDEQATNQVLSDEQRKNLVAQADINRKDSDVQAKNARADEANKTRGEIMRETAISNAQNKKLEITLTAQAKQGAAVKDDLSTLSTDEIHGELKKMGGSTISPSDIEAP